MENQFDMTKDEFDLILKEQKELKELPNKLLIDRMNLISEEYEKTKHIVIMNTQYLDKLEELYNNILKTYKSRTNER